MSDTHVPKTPPYGGPTDEDHICARCGDNRTGCALCAGEPRAIIKSQKDKYHAQDDQ